MWSILGTFCDPKEAHSHLTETFGSFCRGAKITAAVVLTINELRYAGICTGTTSKEKYDKKSCMLCKAQNILSTCYFAHLEDSH